MDRAVCICGVVAKTATKRLGGWRKMFEMRLEEEGVGMLGSAVTCRWFNMHFLSKMIATGDQVVVYGKPKERGNKSSSTTPSSKSSRTTASNRSTSSASRPCIPRATASRRA